MHADGRSDVPDENLDGFLDDIRGLMAVVPVEVLLDGDEADWVRGALRLGRWVVRGTRVCTR